MADEKILELVLDNKFCKSEYLTSHTIYSDLFKFNSRK